MCLTLGWSMQSFAFLGKVRSRQRGHGSPPCPVCSCCLRRSALFRVAALPHTDECCSLSFHGPVCFGTSSTSCLVFSPRMSQGIQKLRTLIRALSTLIDSASAFFVLLLGLWFFWNSASSTSTSSLESRGFDSVVLDIW